MSTEPLESARRLLASQLPAPEIRDGDDPLATLLYDRWFHDAGEAHRQFPEASTYRAMALAARPFVAGWAFEAVVAGAPGAVRARQGDAVRDLPPLAWATEGSGRVRLRPGEAVLVAPMRDGSQGGFWHLWSPAWPDLRPPYLRRWYLQPQEGGELAVAATIAAVAPTDVPWAAKLLCGTHRAGRRDGAVLYATTPAAAWLGALFTALSQYLADAAPPPFTEPVAPGIASADDPGGEVSFGQHRCGLLAAVARACPAALADPVAWCEAVERRLAAERQPLNG